MSEAEVKLAIIFAIVAGGVLYTFLSIVLGILQLIQPSWVCKKHVLNLLSVGLVLLGISYFFHKPSDVEAYLPHTVWVISIIFGIFLFYMVAIQGKLFEQLKFAIIPILGLFITVLPYALTGEGILSYKASPLAISGLLETFRICPSILQGVILAGLGVFVWIMTMTKTQNKKYATCTCKLCKEKTFPEPPIPVKTDEHEDKQTNRIQ
jgi:hypothetical protein